MKITKKLLKKLGCCEDGIDKFINTKELHNLDSDIKSIIIKDDKNMFNDFVFFLNKINVHIVDSIKDENSTGSWEEYTYDNKGNKIKDKDSTGYWSKYTYDDKGNKIKYENSNGSWTEYTYDMNRIEFIIN